MKNHNKIREALFRILLLLSVTPSFSDTLIEKEEFGKISFPDGYTYNERAWKFSVTENIDDSLTKTPWRIEKHYNICIDSISFLFIDSIVDYTIKFSKNWSISGSDGCYGFTGKYALTNDKRIIIVQSGSLAIYCKKIKMNELYQKWDKLVTHMIDESRYEIRNDTLLIKSQMGFMILKRVEKK